MKNKIYSMHATAIDKNGLNHEVTVVGMFTHQKKPLFVDQQVQVEKINERNSFIDATATYKKMIDVRIFKVAYAICHSNDKFDEKYGIKKAEKRIKTNPVYELSSLNFSAFNKDMCNILVFNELMHISKNIDKYLPEMS